MEDGAFGGSFGKYDVTTHDQNKKNTGYNNSLNEGSNFSTTLGGNFSTVVGANFSTTGGLTMSTVVGFNMPVTLGGKIELISPWSIKWTRGDFGAGEWTGATSALPFARAGGYDYDFKNCQTQVKWTEGTFLCTYNSPDMIEYKIGKDGVHKVDKKDDFAKLANAWIGTKNLVAQSEIKKVLDGTMTYGTMTTKVANAYSISETSGLSSLSMTTSGAKIISAGSVEISGHTELNLKCYAKGTFNAAILKFG